MRFLIFLSYIFFNNFLFSQAETKVSKNKFQIGEQIELSYELIFTKNEGLINFVPANNYILAYKKSKKGSIDSTTNYQLEIISSFKDSIFRLNRNELKWQGKYVITAWDTGTFVIPSIQISSQKNTFKTNTIEIQVSIPKVNEKQDIFDIKEKFAEIDKKNSFTTKNWIILVVLLFLISILVIYIIKRKKKQKVNSTEIIPLKERTLLKLEELIKKQYVANGMLQEHYLEFTYIVKNYFSEKYHVNLSDKTSLECIMLLKQLNLNSKDLHQINRLLDDSDLIKFAKSNVENKLVIKHIEIFKKIINQSEA